MNTYAINGADGTQRETDQENFFKIMNQQTYGTIVMYALENWTKSQIQSEFEYDSLEEVDSKIIETIDFVLSIPFYRYGNKYKPYLTAGGKQVLKKLKKLLKGAVI